MGDAVQRACLVVVSVVFMLDATADVAAQPTGIDEQSLAAAEGLRARRPNLDFHEMGIPDGAVLECPAKGAFVTVVGPKKVRLGDVEMSLTAATRQVLQLDYHVQPSPHWTYHGRQLREMYDETYADPE